MKKLIPAYVISLVFSFMLFIYEPISMYASNMDDFWFDFFIIINPLIKTSLIAFGICAGLFTILYIVNRLFSKKTILYNIILLIFFIIFVCSYIQGNFMAGSLPALDGRQILWYNKANFVNNLSSTILWLVVIGGVVYASIKLTTDKAVKYTTFGALLVLVMLGSSFITTLTTTENLYRQEVSVTPTLKDEYAVSTNKNFFILLLDAVDSSTADDVMDDYPEYQELFKDFTYFKDTTSLYPFTRDNIPLILGGSVYKNEEDFRTYYTKTMNESPLIDELLSRDYKINLLEDELMWDSPKALKVNNLVSTDRTIDENKFIREVVRYDLFKYLPFFAKKVSRIENLDFTDCKVLVDAYRYRILNDLYYEQYKEGRVDKIKDKWFNFMHLEGAHVPFRFDKDMNEISNGTYDQKVAASLTIAKAYIERLKDNDLYDNSVIIVMADHGYNTKSNYGRQNPILFIKGIDEHHKKMIRSDKAVSFTDLNSAYIDLLDDKKSTELFKNIDNNRIRKYYFYEYGSEDTMIEYDVMGHAWDTSLLKKTGKEYNR